MATDLGLLGFDDPKTLGLLSLGLRLMSTPGKFGTALGQSGLGALGDMQAQRQMLQQQKRQQMMDSIALQQAQQQKAEFERQQQERAAIEAAAKGALAPGKLPSYMDARDIGLPGELPAIPAQQFDSNKFVQNLLPVMPLKAMEYQAALKRATPSLTTLKKDESAGYVDPETGMWKSVVEGKPTQDKPDELEVTLRKAGIMPGTPQYAQAYADRAKKLTTQPPGVQVSYGAPLPAINPKTGETELARPDNKGGIQFTGVKPPAQNRDVKVPAEIQRMNIAADTMGKLLNDYEALLDKYNPRDPMVQASPTVRAEFQSLMKGLQLQFKEVQALGALAGPDLALMEAAITDPFTMRGAYYGKDGLRGQIKQARRLLSLRKQASAAATSGAGSTPDNDPLGVRK